MFRNVLAVVANSHDEHALLSISNALVNNVHKLLHHHLLHNYRNDALARIEAVMELIRGDLQKKRQLCEHDLSGSLSAPS
jgi:hypothetical protein